MKTLTLQEYRALEAAGRIQRPLTDDPIGRASTDRRNRDARNSEIVTARPTNTSDRLKPKETPR